jgi:dihydropteroate synthase
MSEHISFHIQTRSASDTRGSIETTSLRAGRYSLALTQPLVMGIVNVTPDSFSDGGKFLDAARAIAHAHALADAGADVLDIGGESTRPGAAEVGEQEELDRVIPVIEALVARNLPLSIDTQKPAVMREAIAAGASMVNDVAALRATGALEACAAADVAVCLMHMQGEPRTMQAAPQYEDVVAEVKAFLLDRAAVCERAGISRNRIVIDPGIGFGKTLEHNLALLRAAAELADTGYPLLIGVSRKSMFKALFGLESGERLVPSVVAAVLAAQQGAAILRVHDVRETVQALTLMRRVDPPGGSTAANSAKKKKA